MGSCIYQQVPVTVKGKPTTIVNETQQRETVMINSTQSTFTIQSADPRNSKRKYKQPIALVAKEIGNEIKETPSSSRKVVRLLAEFQKTHLTPKAIQLKDFIINPLREYMQCKVCSDILIAPKHCSKCNLLMCSQCYDSTQGIICQHTPSDINADSSLKSLMLSLQSENFKCFNWKNQCEEIVPYVNLSYKAENNSITSLHEKSCKVKSLKCIHPGCIFKGSLKEYPSHIQSCSYAQFECFYCKQLLKRLKVKEHPCFQTKSPQNIIPVFYCECGERCEWLDYELCPGYAACSNSQSCLDICYYKCAKCKELKCTYHYPIQIAKVCGCGHRLTGGILKKCSLCGFKGGIGWSCTACKRGIGLCEDCLCQV